MVHRGVQLSHETMPLVRHVRPPICREAQAEEGEAGDKWHLDEMFLKINGVQHYLWRAVDQHGAVIDILVQPKRDRFAVMRFFRSCYVHVDDVLA